MNSTLFILALLQITISVVLAVCILYLSYKTLKLLFFKDHEFKNNHLAFTIFTSGIFISIAIILSEIIPSISNIIRLSVTQNKSIDYLNIVTYSGIYLVSGFMFTLIVNSATFLLYSSLTKSTNEFKEIKEIE